VVIGKGREKEEENKGKQMMKDGTSDVVARLTQPE